MKSDNPLVSICMPAYNAGKYIQEAIQSIEAQSYTNWELVIVNDGSTDNTMEVLSSYVSHPRIKVLSQPNRGQCAAANAAFKASTGTFIKFMDADDLISTNFLEGQINALGGREDAIASASWGRFYDDDIQTFKLNPETVWRNMRPIDWLVASLESGHNMMQCALWLIPRKVLEKSGLWDERLTLINDFDFFIRVLLESSDILFAKGAVLYYRSGVMGSLSGTKSRKGLESAFLSISLGIQRLLKAENTERVRKAGADIFQLWKYEFYPKHIDLYLACEEQVRIMGGSDYAFPCGGVTKILTRLVGWKLAKRIRMMAA